MYTNMDTTTCPMASLRIMIRLSFLFPGLHFIYCSWCHCIFNNTHSHVCKSSENQYEYQKKKFKRENSARTLLLCSLELTYGFQKPCFTNLYVTNSKQRSTPVGNEKLTLGAYLGNQAQKAFEGVIHMLKSFLLFQGLCQSETSAKVGTGYQTTTKPSALMQSVRGEDTSAQFRKEK